MVYNTSHILILLGISVSIVSIFIIFLKEKNGISEEYIISPSNSNEDLKNLCQELFKKGNEMTIFEIEGLKKEVIYLRKVIQENNLLLKNHNIKSIEDEVDNKDFKHILNYNQFVNKNKSIIDLFNQNKSSEEIAKLLDKSVREIEMVIKLIKWGETVEAFFNL